MAYNKNTWANGDVITAEKLNNIEDGIADGGGLRTVLVNGNKSSDGFIENDYFSTSIELGEHILDIFRNRKPIDIQVVTSNNQWYTYLNSFDFDEYDTRLSLSDNSGNYGCNIKVDHNPDTGVITSVTCICFDYDD